MFHDQGLSNTVQEASAAQLLCKDRREVTSLKATSWNSQEASPNHLIWIPVHSTCPRTSSLTTDHLHSNIFLSGPIPFQTLPCLMTYLLRIRIFRKNPWNRSWGLAKWSYLAFRTWVLDRAVKNKPPMTLGQAYDVRARQDYRGVFSPIPEVPALSGSLGLQHEVHPCSRASVVIQSLSHVQLPWTAARQLPCSSLSPSACSNSRPLSWWCYPDTDAFSTWLQFTSWDLGLPLSLIPACSSLPFPSFLWHASQIPAPPIDPGWSHLRVGSPFLVLLVKPEPFFTILLFINTAIICFLDTLPCQTEQLEDMYDRCPPQKF